MELCGSKDLGAITGGKYLTPGGTASATGDFFAILCLATASVTLISPILPGQITGSALTTIPMSPGTILYGRFSSVTVVSGNVVAYNNK